MQANPYRTFKALGIFLCYPKKEWLQNAESLCDLIAREGLLAKEDAQSLHTFAKTLQSQDILEAQEEYVDAFDRIRALSLHLFEHVHGDSRDRGQAMVDLTERYKEQGFELAASELPDYLPIFLEYLSFLPKEAALEDLAETGAIIAGLGRRLAERGSPYSAVFNCLIRLSGGVPAKVTQMIDKTMPSFEQMDKEWEEKQIEFLGAEAPEVKSGGGCGGGNGGGCSSGGCGGKSAKPTEARM
jgi:nitrate reductase delta subunit